MKILCYGDSNTYGYDAADPFGGRLAPELCWPGLLGRVLGCEAVNCGLNGRRVPRFQRTTEADLALLRRHAPAELILVMLGTNDLLCEAGAEDTASQMRRFLESLQTALPESVPVLLAPPPVPECAAAFEELAGLYEALAGELGIPFVDTTCWGVPLAFDGVHFTAQGHRLFAMKLAQTLRAMLRG